MSFNKIILENDFIKLWTVKNNLKHKETPDGNIIVFFEGKNKNKSPIIIESIISFSKTSNNIGLSISMMLIEEIISLNIFSPDIYLLFLPIINIINRKEDILTLLTNYYYIINNESSIRINENEKNISDQKCLQEYVIEIQDERTNNHIEFIPDLIKPFYDKLKNYIFHISEISNQEISIFKHRSFPLE